MKQNNFEICGFLTLDLFMSVLVLENFGHVLYQEAQHHRYNILHDQLSDNLEEKAWMALNVNLRSHFDSFKEKQSTSLNYKHRSRNRIATRWK